MTGRGHEGIASDCGTGPIFGVERDDDGRWWATVRTMDLARIVLARRECESAAEAQLSLARLLLWLATSRGEVEETLREWETKG